MSDTSGRPSLPKSQDRIKRDTKKYGPNPKKWPTSSSTPKQESSTGSRAQKETEASAKSAVSVPLDRVKAYVWQPLAKDGIMDRAFHQSELLAYMKRMAELIETSKAEGIEGVTRDFEVKEDAAFAWLQRKIRETADTKKSTDFAGPASRGFQTGSTEWAATQLGKGDPTKFKLHDVVQAIRKNVDQALILSASRILFNFCDRVLEGALPGGDSNQSIVKYFKAEYQKQHESFMRSHNEGSMWGSKTLTKTVKDYERALLQS